MPPEGEPFHPADYIRVLRRRKVTILVVTAVSVALALGYSLAQRPVYEATAEVLLRQPAADSLFSGDRSQPSDPARILQTEIRVIKGPDVRAAVRRELRATPPSVTASAVQDADVIRITARSDQARRAARAANAYAKAYTDLRRQQAIDDVLAASREIQARISELQIQIDAASGVERDALIQAQAVFRQKLGEAQVGSALSSGGARVVAAATTPQSPVSPKPVRSALWALSFGMVLGLGVAFLRDYLDDSVKTKEDLNRAVPDPPTIGMIPIIPGWKDTEVPRLLVLNEPQSATAEAFRTLRTAIQFLDFDHPPRVLQITSPSTREGKTTTAANLGVAIAEPGKKVAVVGCDLRRPRLHGFFGLPNDQGLTSVAIGSVSLEDALLPVKDQPGLFVLPSGPLPGNPSDVLGSKRVAEILESLLTVVDVVILDCPPLLPVTDALMLSSSAEASLIICRANVTSRRKVARAVELLRQVGAPLAGTILNGVAADEYGSSYEYYRSEGSAPGSEPKRSRPKRLTALSSPREPEKTDRHPA